MDDLNSLSRLPAFLLTAALLALIFSDVRHELIRLVRGRNVVLIGIGIWYLFEAIVIPAELASRYRQGEYNLGIACVGAAMVSFLAAYHYTKGCLIFPNLGRVIQIFDNEKLLWHLVLFGALVGFSPIIYNTGVDVGGMLNDMFGMRENWGGQTFSRSRYGDARAAFLMLEMFIGGVAPFAAILLLGRRTAALQRLFCLLVVTWPILRGLGSGTRSSLLPAVAALLAVLFWKANLRWRRVMIIAVICCLPLLYGAMAAIAISRNSGSFSWNSQEDATYVGNEMFRELLSLLTRVPGEIDYQYGYSYYVQLVNPIPRFLWPGKPTMESGLLLAQLNGEVNESGEAFLTRSPGLIGEMYWNFGFFGIVALSSFGGWLVKGWDGILDTCGDSLVSLIFFSGGLVSLFLMGRSFTLTMFYSLISFGIVALLLSFIHDPGVRTQSEVRAT